MSEAAIARVRIPPIIAVCVIPLFIHAAIVETSRVPWATGLGFGGLVRTGLITITALTHWTIYAGLLATFGLTLRPGREALITAIAVRLEGTISDELAIYTRRVTWAWCYFFATQLTLSVSLFFFAPLVVWSFFVNVLDIPLVALMFGAEYVCRLRCLSHPPRHSFAQIVRMITDIVNAPKERRD